MERRKRKETQEKEKKSEWIKKIGKEYEIKESSTRCKNHIELKILVALNGKFFQT